MRRALEDMMASEHHLKLVCLCSGSERKVNEHDIVGNSRYFGWLRCSNCKRYFDVGDELKRAI